MICENPWFPEPRHNRRSQGRSSWIIGEPVVVFPAPAVAGDSSIDRGSDCHNALCFDIVRPSKCRTAYSASDDHSRILRRVLLVATGPRGESTA